MPWASSPPMSPASTSPLPPVASDGGALTVIAARPSGAAMTVSGPLSSTTAPGFAGRGAGAGQPVAFVGEEPRKFAVMRRQNFGASAWPE